MCYINLHFTYLLTYLQYLADVQVCRVGLAARDNDRQVTCQPVQQQQQQHRDADDDGLSSHSYLCQYHPCQMAAAASLAYTAGNIIKHTIN